MAQGALCLKTMIVEIAPRRWKEVRSVVLLSTTRWCMYIEMVIHIHFATRLMLEPEILLFPIPFISMSFPILNKHSTTE